MNTAATAIIGHTYGHTGQIPTVCVAVVAAICATPATFVAGVAGVATASEWGLRSSIFENRGGSGRAISRGGECARGPANRTERESRAQRCSGYAEIEVRGDLLFVASQPPEERRSRP